MVRTDEGLLRDAYLGAARRLRSLLDDTAVLDRWDHVAAAAPRSTTAWLRTLVAVHNADDLVAMDLPWWTYESVDVVQAFLADRGGRARVFEYGSGASTVWLARRAAIVDTVEHHAEWAQTTKRLLRDADGATADTTVHVVPAPPATAPLVTSSAPSGTGLDFAAYVDEIDRVDDGPVDLVVVDGRARVACLARALDRVAPGGMVLLDDADRDRYGPALDAARNAGWRVTVTRGRTPCQPLPRATAVLVARD